jgi:transcriptional regulator with XRE-family HTH domain
LRDARRRRRWTQSGLGSRVGMGGSRIGQLEAGRGGSAPLEAWVRLGIALGRPLAVSFSRDVAPSEPDDAGHLAGQELVLALARRHGRTGLFELPTRPSPRDGGSVDVGIRDDPHRVLILVEVWNRASDLGNASRTSARKVFEVEGLARFRGYRIAHCWLFVDTAASRALVRRFPEVLRSQFRGSSIEWVRCLAEGAPPPRDPGLAWVDPRARRIRPLRLPR